MKNGAYVMLGAGLIMCLAGAYLMITEDASTGIVIGGAGVLFLGASAIKRKKQHG
jgi:hypothetical protein